MVKYGRQLLKVLGTGSRLPSAVCQGSALITKQCLIGERSVTRAKAIARCLGIEQRQLCRELCAVLSAAKPDNPALALSAIQQALQNAELTLPLLDYLIGHTASPHTLTLSNMAWVSAQRLPHPTWNCAKPAPVLPTVL